MSQKTISSYFGKRKRVEIGDIKAEVKKLHLDHSVFASNKITNDETKISKSNNTNAELDNKKQADIRSLLDKTEDVNQKAKSERIIIPAYQKYGLLIKNPDELPLPVKYKELGDFFEATDTVCAMMTNRKEDITFKKLKTAVENMLKKNFTIQRLGQIISVMPSAYSYELIKIKSMDSDALSASRQELVIKFKEGVKITSKLLVERKEEFYRLLLEKTKDYHEEWLKNLDPPIEVNRNDLKRWHPEFMVYDVPDIVPVELPQPIAFKQPMTAKSVLERARHFSRKCLKLQNSSNEETKTTASATENSLENLVKERLSGTFTFESFRERLRAKKAAEKSGEIINSDNEKIDRVFITAESLKRLFTCEKRNVLPYDCVMDKIELYNKKYVSKANAENHIKLLTEFLPEWISVINIKNKKFIKINKSVNVSSALLHEKLKS